jgi:hypothetical protein
MQRNVRFGKFNCNANSPRLESGCSEALPKKRRKFGKKQRKEQRERDRE